MGLDPSFQSNNGFQIEKTGMLPKPKPDKPSVLSKSVPLKEVTKLYVLESAGVCYAYNAQDMTQKVSAEGTFVIKAGDDVLTSCIVNYQSDAAPDSSGPQGMLAAAARKMVFPFMVLSTTEEPEEPPPGGGDPPAPQSKDLTLTLTITKASHDLFGDVYAIGMWE